MKFDVDIAIVGAGPAGAASAIRAAQSGLRVALVERLAFPRHRPGESLHPGLETLFDQLGVNTQVRAAAGGRFSGISVEWGQKRDISTFGSTDGISWYGYQIHRAALDSILLARAAELGVHVIQSDRAIRPIFDSSRISGFVTERGSIRAPIIVDASGRSFWLARSLGVRHRVASPPLIARYGYCEGNIETLRDMPRLTGDRTGWVWRAQIRESEIAWVALRLRGVLPSEFVPEDLGHLRNIGRHRSAPVTWRMLIQPSGPGYFIVGDAAAALDPASSHGVIRAIMSGIMASHLAIFVLDGRLPEAAARENYEQWLSGWWTRDAHNLSDLYRDLDPCWPTPGEMAGQIYSPDLKTAMRPHL